MSGAPVRDVGVVIVAAGRGTRTGSAELKQFRWVAGKPMLLHSLQTFMARADVAQVVCVLPRDYCADPPPWIFQCDIDRLLLAAGGRERGDSVLAGLEDMPPEVKIVLVHDAARPFVEDATITRVIDAARAGEGAVPALPALDTMKRVNAVGLIAETLPREELWSAQTPQGFPRAMIERAYREARAANAHATDDAALCERIGLPVRIVPGSARAFKITDESDFARADAMPAA
jgi:2-C-methyl-D-erythritol 4-phosphate cytidylyltransferase